MLNLDEQEAMLEAEYPCKTLDNSLLPRGPLAEVWFSGVV